MPSLFNKKIDSLKGIGLKSVGLYNKLKIQTVGDLLCFYPRTYEDWSNPVKITDLKAGEISVIKAKLSGPVIENKIPGGMLISKARVFDDSGFIVITFFNNKFIKTMLHENVDYFFYGKVTQNLGHFEMINPMFSAKENEVGIRPIYNQTAGLNSRQIAKAMKEALLLLPLTINEPLPDWILEKYKLCPLSYAIENIHFPRDFEALKLAKERLIFEELLTLSLGLSQLKDKNREETSLQMTTDFSEEFIKLLPFELTEAQSDAINDCINDMMNRKTPMNRLIQGDVGSGKTVVAAAACYSAVKNGWQAAFMAPTEILANQHFQSLSKILIGSGVKIELLTGSVPAKQKKQIKELLKNGEIDFIIGTHALLSDGVEFQNLGLVVTDEQHRFGVAQRAALLSKGNNPHLMVMSATPIPRTLGLIIYGDLDISVINELPPNRKEIETYLVDSSKRTRIFNFMKKHIAAGKQCYIVCPLIEESDIDAASAAVYFEELINNDFKGYNVGLLHGKCKPKEKDEVMNRFQSGEIDVLVTTTVIEVGVDVKNAVIMLIENAERYGLSQLHQLRGRIGRGDEKSYCILISDMQNEETTERLKILCSTSNGFKIADEDLRLRGPGDFFGSRQHGLPQMKIADITDMKSVLTAKEAAEDILEVSKDLSNDEFRGIRALISKLFSGVGDNAFN
ncbi:MAG: ATP-dependent DNA helicase RecG [Bacillota bacterium]|nr:ATP-dependent DNA helicase RecG [Bacillota bacterium]